MQVLGHEVSAWGSRGRGETSRLRALRLTYPDAELSELSSCASNRNWLRRAHVAWRLRELTLLEVGARAPQDMSARTAGLMHAAVSNARETRLHWHHYSIPKKHLHLSVTCDGGVSAGACQMRLAATHLVHNPMPLLAHTHREPGHCVERIDSSPRYHLHGRRSRADVSTRMACAAYASQLTRHERRVM